jgi:hypothetical protein
MFRAALYRCAAALDRADCLITLLRLGVLDRLAGPMPENPADPLDESWARRPQPRFVVVEHDLAGLGGAGPAGEAARNALAAE